MRCLDCNTEIPEGSLYCPVCGRPVQIVPDYTSLEDLLADEVNGVMLEDERRARVEKQEREQQAAIEAARVKYEERTVENQRQKQQRKKQRTRNLVLAVTILIVIAALALIGVSFLQNKNSYPYQIAKGEELLQQSNPDKALICFGQANQIAPDKAEPFVGIGRCYMQKNDTQQAEAYFKQAISMDASCTEAYGCLIDLYELLGAPEKIRDLLDGAQNAAVRKAYGDYMAGVPVFAPEPGEYSDVLTVTINAEAGTIHYTTDGMTATDDSPVYTGGIELTESGTYSISAVTVSEKGIVSKSVSSVYTIDLEAPDNPTVYPDAGTYTTYQTIDVEIPENSTVYYTFDGSDPDESCPVYEGPVEMPEGESTFSCVAINEHGLRSSVIRRAYNLIYLY